MVRGTSLNEISSNGTSSNEISTNVTSTNVISTNVISTNKISSNEYVKTAGNVQPSVKVILKRLQLIKIQYTFLIYSSIP